MDEKRIDMRQFRRLYIALPEDAPYARIIVIPLAAVIYNLGQPCCNVDRIIYDTVDMTRFFEAWGILIG